MEAKEVVTLDKKILKEAEQIAFEAGYRAGIKISQHDSGCYGVIQPSPTCIACQWRAFKQKELRRELPAKE